MPAATNTISQNAETIYLEGDARIIAEQCARGDYQHRLVAGLARWSGADLSLMPRTSTTCRPALHRRHLVRARHHRRRWQAHRADPAHRRVARCLNFIHHHTDRSASSSD